MNTTVNSSVNAQKGKAWRFVLGFSFFCLLLFFFFQKRPAKCGGEKSTLILPQLRVVLTLLLAVKSSPASRSVARWRCARKGLVVNGRESKPSRGAEG